MSVQKVDREMKLESYRTTCDHCDQTIGFRYPHTNLPDQVWWPFVVTSFYLHTKKIDQGQYFADQQHLCLTCAPTWIRDRVERGRNE